MAAQCARQKSKSGNSKRMNNIPMLSPYLQTRLVEKVLTDRASRRFRCLFLVTLVDGGIKAQLIVAEPIFVRFRISQGCGILNLTDTATRKNFCLPAICSPKKIFTERVWLPAANPFVPKDFSFVISQMTRAPSKC